MRILRLNVVAALLALAFSATANADLIITAEDVTVPFSATDQTASFEVYVWSDRAAAPDLLDWQITMLSPAPSVTYLGGTRPVDHPYVLADTEFLFKAEGGSELLAVGSGWFDAAPLDSGDGLVRLDLAIAGGTAPGVYPLSFSTDINDTFLTGPVGDFADVLTQSGFLFITGEHSHVHIAGGGTTYRQNFDGMGTNGAAGISLPEGWDSAHNLVTSQDYPTGVIAEGIYNVGNSPDRALAIGIGEAASDSNELTLALSMDNFDTRAWRVMADIETWAAGAGASDPFDAGFQVSLETGDASVDLGTIQHSLAKPTDGPELRDGNLAANRIRFDSGVVEHLVTAGSDIEIRFDASNIGNTADTIVGLDNVVVRAVAPGDADGNGVVDVADLLTLLGGQKFNQGVSNVTWGQGDFNGDDQFNTVDLLTMLSFLRGQFPSAPYASEAGGSSDSVADVIVNSETGEITVDLAGHTVSAIIIESASEIFNGVDPEWDTTSQFPSTLPGELGNVLFTATASGVDELGALISAEFLGRDKEFYLNDLDLNILIASEGGALTKGNVIVVPEPSTWMLLVFGSLSLLSVVRRRLK